MVTQFPASLACANRSARRNHLANDRRWVILSQQRPCQPNLAGRFPIRKRPPNVAKIRAQRWNAASTTGLWKSALLPFLLGSNESASLPNHGELECQSTPMRAAPPLNADQNGIVAAAGAQTG